MTAGPWTFPNATRSDILSAVYNMPSDSFKVALVTSASNIGASSTTWAGVTGEVAAGNGYSTGGIAVTLVLSGTTSVTVSFAADPVWTASGGSIVARTAVLYKVSGRVLAYCLLDNTPADVTITAGNSLTIDSDGVPGPVLTLA
jgi:hypothetical protein